MKCLSRSRNFLLEIKISFFFAYCVCLSACVVPIPDLRNPTTQIQNTTQVSSYHPSPTFGAPITGTASQTQKLTEQIHQETSTLPVESKTLEPVYSMTPTLELKPTPTFLTITPTPKPNIFGWLAFSSMKNGVDGIAIMRVDGLGWRMVMEDSTTTGQHPHAPIWSPDGKWIAFLEHGKNGEDIYLMHPDGTNIVRLTNTPGIKSGFSWSADGKSILYASIIPLENEIGEWLGDRYEGLQLVNIGTGRITQLKILPSLNIASPKFSPDGKKIAFAIQSKDNADEGLFVSDIDGNNLQQVSNLPVRSYSWSPDGQQIVFATFHYPFCDHLYIVNLNTHESRQITDGPGVEFDPSWSPDGEWIGFSSDEICHIQSGKFFLIRSDGSGYQLLRVPKFQTWEDNLEWSPFPALNIGSTFTITESGNGIGLQAEPSLKADIVERLLPGEQILVLDGPQNANSYDFLWWRVRLVESGIEGWINEVPGWFARKW